MEQGLGGTLQTPMAPPRHQSDASEPKNVPKIDSGDLKKASENRKPLKNNAFVDFGAEKFSKIVPKWKSLRAPKQAFC